MFEKGGTRDVGQVLANSVAGVLFLLVFIPDSGNPDLATAPMIAYVGAIAAVTADTWSTEIGTFPISDGLLFRTLGRSLLFKETSL